MLKCTFDKEHEKPFWVRPRWVVCCFWRTHPFRNDFVHDMQWRLQRSTSFLEQHLFIQQIAPVDGPTHHSYECLDPFAARWRTSLLQKLITPSRVCPPWSACGTSFFWLVWFGQNYIWQVNQTFWMNQQEYWMRSLRCFCVVVIGRCNRRQSGAVKWTGFGNKDSIGIQSALSVGNQAALLARKLSHWETISITLRPTGERSIKWCQWMIVSLSNQSKMFPPEFVSSFRWSILN